MAVDSKQNGTNGATANGAKTKGNRKRPSSLMAHASALPTVEHSLEEFIAKANQTLVDVSAWGNADAEAKAAEEARRQQDALRMKAAETQMREGEQREISLRRQLDGLQGKLAEAEARAAVASTTAGSAANDAALQALRDQIEMAEAQRKAAELEKQNLARALKDAKEEVAVVRATAAMPAVSIPVDTSDNEEALERIRLAEAKAAKAIAAAKAAQAGLNVSSDIAAIESGLVVAEMPAGKSGAPWALIAIAFIGGLGIMFAVWKFVLSKDDAKNTTTPAAATQPAAAPTETATPSTNTAPAAAPTEAAKPTVTPIEEPGAANKPTVEPIEEPAAVKEEPKAAAEETKAPTAMEEPKAAVKEEPKAAVKPAVKKAEPKKVAPKKETPKKEAPKKATKPAVVDPFGETPAPKKTAPKKETKPASGGIVDPF